MAPNTSYDVICMVDFLEIIERLPKDIQAQFETMQQLNRDNRELLARKKQEFLLKLHIGEIKGEAEIELERQVIRKYYDKFKCQSEECVELLNDLQQLLQCYLQHFDTEFAEWREQLNMKMPELVVKLEKYSRDIHNKRLAAATLMQAMQEAHVEQRVPRYGDKQFGDRGVETLQKKLKQKCIFKKLLRCKQPKHAAKETPSPQPKFTMHEPGYTVALCSSQRQLTLSNSQQSLGLSSTAIHSKSAVSPLAQRKTVSIQRPMAPIAAVTIAAIAVKATAIPTPPLNKKSTKDLSFIRRLGYKLNFQFVLDFHEKLDCICEKLSCGTMLACDKHCPYEWFHLKCVNMKNTPAAECQHCPLCSQAIKPGAACKLCEHKHRK